MNYWVNADDHLGHENLVKYLHRPKDYYFRILDGISKTVKPGDTYIDLGDVALNREAFHHDMLHSYLQDSHKILVLGNHDHKSKAWYLDHGWDMVCDSFTLNYLGETILFSHMPSKNNFNFTVNIHGHFHNNDHRMSEPDLVDRLSNKHILLAPEFVNYRPLKLETIIKRWNARENKEGFYTLKNNV
jgi:calcineurin-like phosphoesterase family protein